MITFGTESFTELSVTITDTSAVITVSGDGTTFAKLEKAVNAAKGTFTLNGVVYTGFENLISIQKMYDTGIEGVTTTYDVILRNTNNSFEIITGGSNLTIDEAMSIRRDIENMAKNLADEDSEAYAWAFPAWSGNSVAYAVGDRVAYETLLYKCVQAHTSQPDWTPTAAVSLWVRVTDPAIEYPDWVQPAGAHDAYNKGDKVSHNGKHWISDVDANVWEPGVYGWSEATEG